MKTINNYNSCAPLSDYEIGTVYSFYLNNPQMSRLVKADQKTTKKYSDVLVEAVNSNNDFIASDGKYMNLVHAIGVVVDKLEATTPNSVDMIIVMFKTSTDDYVINKYAVNTFHVNTNNKNYVSPAAVINVTVA